MNEADKRALHAALTAFSTALDEMLTRDLVLIETMRELLPEFAPIFDNKYRDRKNQQTAGHTLQASELVRLLDVLVAAL